jgi:DNA replication protein DnaC
VPAARLRARQTQRGLRGEFDRLIHHAEILSLKGDSYRLRGKDLDNRPARTADLA